MPERVFLTDARRAVLRDEFDGAASTEHSHRSRIRTRSRLALKELIEVAQSEEIENADVFDPGDIEALITALYTGDGFVPFRIFDGSRQEYAQHIAYQLDLHARLDRLTREFSTLAHQDPEAGTGLIPPDGYDGLQESR